jgi:hypothetical protein
MRHGPALKIKGSRNDREWPRSSGAVWRDEAYGSRDITKTPLSPF